MTTFFTKVIDEQIQFGSGSAVNADDIPESASRVWLTPTTQTISGSKTFTDIVYFDSDIYVNYNGPDGDSHIYFYDGSSPAGKYLMWDDSPGRFVINDDFVIQLPTGITQNKGIHIYGTTGSLELLNGFGSDDMFGPKIAGVATTGVALGEPGMTLEATVPNDNINNPGFMIRVLDNTAGANYQVEASDIVWFQNDAVTRAKITKEGNIKAANNIYINYDGADGDSYLYFYDVSSDTGQYLMWDDNPGNFVLSGALNVNGISIGTTLSSLGNIYVNYDGADGDSYLYFYEGSAAGAYIKWWHTAAAHYFSNNVASSGWLVVGGAITSSAGDIKASNGNLESTLGCLQIKDGMTAPATTAGLAKIYVDSADGDLKVKFGDGYTAVINADSSDSKFKLNIEPLSATLEKVNLLRPVQFDLTDGAAAHAKKIKGEHYLGLIAQEVAAVYPEVVYEVTPNQLAVDYEKLTAVLIKSVQELKAELDLIKNNTTVQK